MPSGTFSATSVVGESVSAWDDHGVQLEVRWADVNGSTTQ